MSYRSMTGVALKLQAVAPFLWGRCQTRPPITFLFLKKFRHIGLSCIGLGAKEENRSRNETSHSRNGISQLEQSENHNSRSNSRSDSQNGC